MGLELSAEEQRWLAGGLGPGVRKAMEIVVALGQIYGARRLVPVSSVQVAGVSYRNLGQAGLEFLREWAAQDARVRVPTTLNPAGIDLQAWQALGFSEGFAQGQLAVIEAYRRLGVQATCTCTPYLVGTLPGLGEHVAWAESSAVSYANSILGARTNREGGPGALAAAIVGRTAAYGLHLDENRHATLRVIVRCPVRTPSDFGALGYLVGKVARERVPYFLGLDVGQRDALKALGAAMAASGAVALYHVAGITPEAEQPDVLAPGHETLIVDDLRPAYAALNSTAREIDLAWFGCPHASLPEIEQVVRLLAGRRVKSALWITAAREVREHAQAEGLVAAVEASGGRVVADMCAVVAPMQELGLRTVATPSAKGATYLPSHAGLLVRYGTVEQCVEAAVSGVWED
ncbi:MAG TPA: aconitase X catalytic domain-containing protein [Anaerolineae bacterium]|nr:aconitase X catalytic domain-containing protein [Anaerolineae bacterium]